MGRVIIYSKGVDLSTWGIVAIAGYSNSSILLRSFATIYAKATKGYFYAMCSGLITFEKVDLHAPSKYQFDTPDQSVSSGLVRF